MARTQKFKPLIESDQTAPVCAAGNVSASNFLDRMAYTNSSLRELQGDQFVENEKGGAILVLIPAGTYLAGEDPFPGTLPAYYLELHPVTNALYERVARETGDLPPDTADWGDSVWRCTSYPIE